MLPLVDRPVIHYAVEEAVNSGIEQVIIVTALGKRAVEDYFDRSPEIEAVLREKGDLERLAEIQRISDMADVIYVRQKEQRGIGHAVLSARGAVGNEPFVLFLPDDVIISDTPAAKQLIDCFHEHRGSVVAVEEVPPGETSSYGIVAGERIDGRLIRVTRLVEKPAAEEAPSNLGIVGRYVLTPSVFAAIERTAPGYGGEIQITDALQVLADEEGVYAYQFEGCRYDTGRPLSLLVSSIAVALTRPDIGPELRRYLRELDLGD